MIPLKEEAQGFRRPDVFLRLPETVESLGILWRMQTNMHLDYFPTLSIQVCPKEGISPTILFWGWD